MVTAVNIFFLKLVSFLITALVLLRIKGGKVCRDVGHRKKYADKVKNDPVWLTYSRAYKAHYARYMKKKMTQAEFQQWADFALDIREQALNEKISFEEYAEKIKF